ncbi:peptidoglycan amidohydrolase family protein [Limosilactobacillus reuteri]|uniref:peptidoglycan amidohydrolase family protein n=1 Tax=Limosilactobacillus reuteri TaxID=1598 RepID=UPI001E5617B5|nr:peptidoglycan amidohydrolase family protein [Limosilactobacillus reuteri]MCC4468028.1 KxYKxGKxW signal peptide domain-containing protein [Limosilactobacillus reuteri]MCC4472582.1 KxYKxGKxW signal peptide domain-containing protein [Limosilactobacillus reuteri]UXE88668.1 KxYKxGKxW signal peptide domain-containing protein [Limosilactobacillus reuteri]
MKKHYKLYKSGKNWCVMAIATLGITVGLTGIANADTNTTSTPIETTQVQTNTSENESVQLGDTSTNAQTVTENASSAQADSNTSLVTNNNDSNKVGADVLKTVTSTTDEKVDTPVQPQSETVKDGWVKEDKGWTYYTNGTTSTGRAYSYLPTITANGKGNGNNWYLTDNGVVQSGVQQWANTYYDFDPTTYLRVDNNYVQSQWGDWYLFGNDGRILTKVQQWAGTYYYFDPVTYLRVDNDYRQSQWGDWYMFGPDGRIQTGARRWAGSVYYFDPVTYLRVDNGWREGLYFGADGRLVNGGFSTRVINWFLQREGKITYSMYGSRTGADGTADCSGSMTMALRTAGASAPQIIYSTETLHSYLLNNGYYLVYEGRGQEATLQYGDVIIWGKKAASLGGNGHTMVATGSGNNPTVISTCYLTEGQRGTAIQEVNYDWYWNDDNRPYQYVYRLRDQARA